MTHVRAHVDVEFRCRGCGKTDNDRGWLVLDLVDSGAELFDALEAFCSYECLATYSAEMGLWEKEA